jgi:hypothetical protein
MQQQSKWVEVPGSRKTSAFANTREVCIFGYNNKSDDKSNTVKKPIEKHVTNSTDNKK